MHWLWWLPVIWLAFSLGTVLFAKWSLGLYGKRVKYSTLIQRSLMFGPFLFFYMVGMFIYFKWKGM